MDITIPTPSAGIDAYLAQPAGHVPRPGVVVLHDVFGMTDDLRRQCDWLAGAGFLALGPNLYSHGNTPSCLRRTFTDMYNQTGPTFEDIETARTWLSARPNCTGQIGVIGYCMGGTFSLLLAPRGNYAAASVNYGDVPKDAERFLQGACPVIGSYGKKDRRLKGSAARLETALTQTRVVHEVTEYAQAGHGFLNQHTGVRGRLISIAGPLIGVGYDDEAAADARKRIIDFFEEHLAQ